MKKVEKINQNATGIQQFCTFRIANSLFGLSLLDVREVNSELSFTKIFHAHQSVRGYMNIRGQIHLVIDLRILLGFTPSEKFNEHRVVIFKTSIAESSGVLVDSISDVVEVDASLIDSQTSDKHADLSAAQGGIDAALIKGVCRLKDELLVVLDSQKIVDAIRVAHRAA